MFANDKEYSEMLKLLESWTNDPQDIKSAFVKLKDKLLTKKDVTFSFNSRPGVSYSLRASVKQGVNINRRLFTLIDIIDDAIENRWLSVCFYSDMVTDSDEKGNLVPKGILGEDGYCFDVDEYDNSMISYIEQEIDEAYTKTMAL